MPKTRSLIEQAVLDIVNGIVTTSTPVTAMNQIRDAAKRQLEEEAQQRDHRYRRSAEESLNQIYPHATNVGALAEVEHDIEICGFSGAWVHCKVFVPNVLVEDE